MHISSTYINENKGTKQACLLTGLGAWGRRLCPVEIFVSHSIDEPAFGLYSYITQTMAYFSIYNQLTNKFCCPLILAQSPIKSCVTEKSASFPPNLVVQREVWLMPVAGSLNEDMNSVQANGDHHSMDTFLFTSESVGEGHPGKWRSFAFS